mmetsp:Transcript_24964/g.58576  ORF Transcript_24964/g.58576 Transcript_24964/m.58576 type:complete len:1202 (+) Transcript_24964:64-3669(+)
MVMMGTKQKRESSSTDPESGAIMMEDSSDNSLHRSTLHTKTNHSSINEILDDDDTSGSGMWPSTAFGDDNSTSNDTRFSPTMTLPGSHRSSNPISEESINIAKIENLAVMTWRLLMFGVLIVTTITVAVLVYAATYRSERNEFRTSFDMSSEKIYHSLGISIDTKLEAVDSLATLLVSSAREKNETWPFTTLPDFGVKAAKIRMLSGAIALQQYQYVIADQKSEWEAFAKANEAWVHETIEIQRGDTTLGIQEEIPDYKGNFSTKIRRARFPTTSTGPFYTPTWHTYPMLATGNFTPYNWNAIEHRVLGAGIREVLDNHKVVIGPVLNLEEDLDSGNVTRWIRRHVEPDVNPNEPMIRVLYPIIDTAGDAITVDTPESNVVGIIASSFFWRSFLDNVLPKGTGLVVVFKNTCNQTFTYEIDGHETKWLGVGDRHDPQFDHVTITKTFDQIGLYQVERTYGGLPIDVDYCSYTVSTYPSKRMKAAFMTRQPLVYTMIAIGIFFFTALVFIGYDKLVSMRQRKVMKTAVQSTTIVTSLFPHNVRDRLLEEKCPDKEMGVSMFQPNKTRLRTFLNNGEPTTDYHKPIADLFTDTTVLFADIAGFTAWSSVREPTQVFTLLETVYGAFDRIASRRGVFKVETIGDCYVAVSGLPDPRSDHAIVMSKFARDCREQFNELCSSLENTLGPETGDLHLRIGLHSGPVTAGVLRGQKSRFQLFGDTVNTAARMESTCKINKIQVSEVTADLLKSTRKSHWLQVRDEMVEVKGKGLMITYWVEPKGPSSSCTTASITKNSNLEKEDSYEITPRIHSQTERLINWNIDVLERLLKNIIARRIALKRKGSTVNWNPSDESKIVLNEVQEVIKLPEYNAKYSNINAESIVLELKVRLQLREFVTAIALIYNDNPFHNFPHASHVGMSVAKLLSRIVAPDIDLEGHEQLHDHTYGITSDPLTQFACVFSALIHDADHPGVPNSQLVKEGTEMAQTYEGKSIAEQNSINLAWDILLQDKYKDLRKAICKTQSEASRFRQLVVNAVCATDIIDNDLKAARNKRWEKAFSQSSQSSDDDNDLQEQINRKATIVIEHIIQASDVAHMMQHWHIYVKWNERLYAEMYKAYTEGRADRDPTATWYKGEIGFFDYYIIPLAQKLSECGVFGVSSDEYLNYAIMNRSEWEKKGKDVVASYVKKYRDVSDELDQSAREHIEQP